MKQLTKEYRMTLTQLAAAFLAVYGFLFALCVVAGVGLWLERAR